MISLYLAAWVGTALMLALLPPATARLARLITRDSICEPLRTWVRKKWGQQSMAAELIGCHWCVAVWSSLALNTWAWITIYRFNVWGLGFIFAVFMPSVLATAYLASRMIDREDG